jgi:hypothetical protein
MKRGKEFRNSDGETFDPEDAKEIPVLMFAMREQSPGAFRLRVVTNDSVIDDIRAQGSLQSFLDEVDQLYADFRERFAPPDQSSRPN